MPAPAAFGSYYASNAQIFSEHTWLQGAFLAAVAYGMQVILYAMSCYLLVQHRNKTNSRRNIGLIIYITIIFILGTLFIGGLLQFTQEAFIDGREIKGGPDAYQKTMFLTPVHILTNVATVILSWMCDVINVWRCLVIYTGSRAPIWVVGIVPCMMYLASVVLSILFLKQIVSGTQTPWNADAINYTTPYAAVSLALNILVTIMIISRLLVHRYRINRVLGGSHGTQYTNLATIIIESATIYSVFSLLFLVPFALNHPLSQLFIQGISPVQNASTLLIIFRVAQGKGWSQESVSATMITTIGGSRPPIRIHEMKSTFTDVEQNGVGSQAPKFNPSGSAPAIEMENAKRERTVS